MVKKNILAAILALGLVFSACPMHATKTNKTENQTAKIMSLTDEKGDFNSVNLTKGYKSTNNKNPIITQRYSADPGVMEYNGRVYVYGTNDAYEYENGGIAKNSYGNIQTINCISSSDMVNWTDHGTINVAGNNGVAKWARWSWAPCATHKTINGKEKFFLYFANNATGIGVLTSDSPTGPWSDPNGRALISSSTPNVNSDMWIFDPAVLVDTDGTGYLYFGGNAPSGKEANPRTARVVKLADNMTSLAGNPVVIDAPYLFEDSGINKIGNTYYYSYCTNWAQRPNNNVPGIAQIAYMTSNSPMGPFTYQGCILKNPGTYFGCTGNNHHTIINFKNQYYIFYHAEWLGVQKLGSAKGYRTTHVDKINFSNGKFYMADGTLTGVPQVANLDPYTTNRMATIAWEGGIDVYGSGNTVVGMNRGDWVGVSGVAFGDVGAQSVTIKASSNSGATIKICSGSTTGDVVGYVVIPSTGQNTYKTVTTDIKKITGTKNLFFIASGDCNVESWVFNKSGDDPIDDPDDPDEPDNPIPGNSVKLDEGWYYIKNVDSQKYLQVRDNKGAAIQNVEIGTGTGVAGQKWYLENTADGYITLKSGLGNFMLDVANGEDTDGANIQIYDAYAGTAQKFCIMATSKDKVYTIGTMSSGKTKMLDVYNFGKTDGTNVCQWTYGGYENQQWIFEPINGTGGTTDPTTPDDPTPDEPSGGDKKLPTGVSCDYKVADDWENTFHGVITLVNNSNQDINDWTLHCTYNCKITNLWGADLVGQTENDVIIKNPSWDSVLRAGQSVKIEFIATTTGDKSAPVNYYFQ